MKKPFAWLRTSHRLYHLIGFFFVTLFGTLLMAVGGIAAMEFKDVHHSFGNDSKPIRSWNWSAWDWLDVLAGLLGTLPALAIHAALYFLLFNL